MFQHQRFVYRTFYILKQFLRSSLCVPLSFLFISCVISPGAIIVSSPVCVLHFASQLFNCPLSVGPAHFPIDFLTYFLSFGHYFDHLCYSALSSGSLCFFENPLTRFFNVFLCILFLALFYKFFLALLQAARHKFSLQTPVLTSLKSVSEEISLLHSHFLHVL